MREPLTQPAQLTELLAAVQASARLLLADLPGQPRRVQLRVGDVLVELEWAPAGQQVKEQLAEELAVVHQPANGTQAMAEAGLTYIRAELVGTFYHASEPGAKPFVVAGDLVEPGQQVGILEAMKLMTPVKAELGGWITDVLIADGEAVEYGQPLLAVRQGTEE